MGEPLGPVSPTLAESPLSRPVPLREWWLRLALPHSKELRERALPGSQPPRPGSRVPQALAMPPQPDWPSPLRTVSLRQPARPRLTGFRDAHKRHDRSMAMRNLPASSLKLEWPLVAPLALGREYSRWLAPPSRMQPESPPAYESVLPSESRSALVSPLESESLPGLRSVLAKPSQLESAMRWAK
jgi:hypothetical protein